MFCNQCGNFNPDGTQNCVSCGASLMQPSAQANGAAQQTNYQPYNPQASINPQQTFGQPTPAAPVDTGVPGKGAGVTSLVFGIISLALFCIPVLPGIFGIVGLILGIVSVSKAGKAGKKCGVGVAGLICAIIGIVVAILYTIGLAGAVFEGLTQSGISF